ncbi:MAG: TolC family protein [Nitrospiraceae bacterium]|nr:TolC family protein [Nitrospiraceae bacterium]
MRRVIFRGIPVLTAVIMVGCATLQPTDPYTGMEGPEPRSVPSMTAKESDPPPRPLAASLSSAQEGGLSLSECIALALANNPEVAATAWDAEAAFAEKGVRVGERWPSLHVAGSYFHYQDDQRLVPPAEPGGASYFTDDLASADLILRLPLYAGGRIVNEVRAAALLAQSATHILARTRKELVFNVSSIYYGILAQRHVIESLEFSRDVLQEHVDRVRNLIKAQKAAKVDALRTEVRLADVKQQLLQERNALAVQFRLLANFMGVSTTTGSELDIRGDLDMPDADATAGKIARALERREDYAAAMAALEAQAKRVDIARGAREPQVALDASYGGRWGIGGSGDPVTQPSSAYSWTSGNQPSTSSSITRPLPNGGAITTTTSSTGAITTRISKTGVEPADDFEDVGRVGITVDIPLFEGGALRAGVRKERTRLHAAQQRLRKLELQIRLEVDTASLNVDSSRERVAVTRKSILEAEESLRIEREKYDFGKGTIVDVLDAQAALLNTQTSYYRTLRDYNTALVELRLAMGEIETGGSS